MTGGRWRPWLMPLLIVLVLLVAAGSLMLGTVALSMGRIAAVLGGGGDEVARLILVDLRLPRTIVGLAVGAMLGLGGAAMQGWLRNPLADPSVLGPSNGAALGAVAAIYYGWGALHPAVLPLLAVAGALAALVLLFGLVGRSESALTLILAGIAVSTLAGAAISLSLNLSPNPFAAMEIMTWLMGSIENRSVNHVEVAMPCIAAGAALLLTGGRALDALTLGEDGARTLGVDLRAARLRLLIGVAVGIGGAVAVSGAIGFVGLIVPHLIRPFTDRSPSATLLPSMLGGAALLLAADIAVRLVPTATELRLGVVTAFLGVPLFLAYLFRERRLW